MLARMRLRTVFLIYMLSTAAAIVAPYAMTTIVDARRKTIPVNSEPPQEPAPVPQSRPMWSGDGPACSASNGTIYYANGKQSDGGDPGANIQPFDDSLRSDFRTCAVSGDGTVYKVGSADGGPLSLNALEPTAQLKWSVPAQEVCSRPALGPDGSVYLVSRTRAGTTILTGYGAGGSKLWETPIGGTGWHLTAPVIAANGTIYVSATSQLVAIESTGREIWRVSVANSGSENVSGLIVGDDGRIFVQVFHGVVAFNERGEKLWEFLADNQDLDGGIALGGDGTLYLASRFLYALDKTGKPKWNFKSELTYTKRDYFGHQPIIAKDGTIYANTLRDQLYAITPDGRKKWLVSGEPRAVKRAWGQPMLTRDGMLVTNAGWFAVASGLATTGWPSESHDNSNSRRQENP
jgi:PQQ-like domain